jgi:hypothetical protein
MKQKTTPKTDPAATPVPHDVAVAVDAQTPDDPANSGAAANTPRDEQAHPANATVTTAEQPKAASERMATVAPAAAATDGTVTVDFGKAGKLTGCLVLNSVPGAPLQFAEGQQVSVVVPNDEGGTSTISVDGRFVK